ncbi:MAG: DNA repair protein RecN [Fusicatenibacter sp.]|nr:DNA repair protein RecN [Fusicatenibacter sp.]
MLTNLHVKNLALIDEAEVEFGPGLNILTGETGAGKSILLGSVNLALGKKMSREMIRKGAENALVELVFMTENPKVIAMLDEMGVETEEGQVMITRKITGNRSISRVNGEICSTAQIRELSLLLLDIHGQHEHQSLLYPDRQLAILDAYGGQEINSLLVQTGTAYKEWNKIRQELSSYEMDEESRKREMAFLEFEIHEITEAQLSDGEDEELEARYRKMGNARRIAETVNSVYSMTGYDGSTGAGEQIGRALRELQQIVSLDKSLEDFASSLTDIDALINDFNREISSYLEELTFSEEDYYEVEKRLDVINHLKAKYGKTIKAIGEYSEQQQKKLDRLIHFEEQKQRLQEQKKAAEKKLEQCAHKLSEKRKEYGKKMEQQIIEGLQDLNFLHVSFEISFEKSGHYAENGFDTVEFLISTNPGEPVRPLSKVVSGGELSRIMLAIKTLLADRDETETLIFDEIDTGISGRTAQKVSEKMAKIAGRHQVICITHLPQIAAMADYHYEIEKNVDGNGTVSTIHQLSQEESVTELARMLGGAQITESVLANAREMKELAQVQKSSRLK